MAADTALPQSALKRDAKVLSLVSLGHFFSHFFIIVLPPLFPLLVEDLGVTYAALGAILMAENLATTCVQVPVGFLVDRLGARRVLIFGLATMSLAVLLAGLVASYWALLALMVLAGVGNAVFHPADYAIMSRCIATRRLGRAFSVHTFAGHLGWAVAPGIIIAITAVSSWHWALICAGAAGLAATAVMAGFGSLLDTESPPHPSPRPSGRSPQARTPPPRTGIGLLLSRPMLLFFLYMVMAAIATGGLNGFTVAALVALYDAPLTTANLALTAFLTCSAVGVLLGGQLADWTKRHELVLVVGFVSGALVLVAVGSLWLSLTAVIAAVALNGLANGAIRPSRDMMVRKVVPAGSEGKVFGFVTVGMNVGAAMAPVFFGWMIDNELPSWVFFVSALAMVAALFAALAANRAADRAAAPH